MRITKRIGALLLSAAVLLMPLGAAAEGYVIPAGEVTSTAISDCYIGGMQIDVTVDLGIETGSEPTAREQAMRTLLEKTQLTMSFYDDFGTARVRGALTTDGVALLTLDAQIAEDGSVMMKTNLTGESVLALPAGTVTPNGINLGMLAFSESESEINFDDPAFKELPARQRLGLTIDDLKMTLITHLYGWISYTQRETGDLYVFDSDFVDATDTRDETALRMICNIPPWHFMDLLTNIMWTVRDEHGALQQALADVLAEAGVTRYQVRQFVDRMLTKEEMDPAVDWVQPSATVYNDGSLCTKDDIAYAVKKLEKSAEYVMDGTEFIEEIMTLVVSYDILGEVIGVDMDVPIISNQAPYEGAFNYSVKTDENGQRRTIAHGELEVFDGNRLVGDASMKAGQDVDGVNASELSGFLEVRNSEAAKAIGVGVDADITYRTDGGDDAETFEANAKLGLRQNGVPVSEIAAGMQGETSVTGDSFLLAADAHVDVLGTRFTARIAAQANDYDGQDFVGGTAVDLTKPANLTLLQQQVLAQLMGIYFELSSHTDVMNAAMAMIMP